MRRQKEYAEEAVKLRPQYKAENAELKPKIEELKSQLNQRQNIGFQLKSSGASALSSIWNDVTDIASATWNVIKLECN